MLTVTAKMIFFLMVQKKKEKETELFTVALDASIHFSLCLHQSRSKRCSVTYTTLTATTISIFCLSLPLPLRLSTSLSIGALRTIPHPGYISGTFHSVHQTAIYLSINSGSTRRNRRHSHSRSLTFDGYYHHLVINNSKRQWRWFETVHKLPSSWTLLIASQGSNSIAKSSSFFLHLSRRNYRLCFLMPASYYSSYLGLVCRGTDRASHFFLVHDSRRDSFHFYMSARDRYCTHTEHFHRQSRQRNTTNLPTSPVHSSFEQREGRKEK